LPIGRHLEASGKASGGFNLGMSSRAKPAPYSSVRRAAAQRGRPAL
jgi:hypothetical protein